jgi:hypothetical protein
MCDAFLLHADVATKTLSLFMCTHVDVSSTEVLTNDYAYECYSSQHILALALYGVGGAVIVVAIPLGALVRIRRFRAHLKRDDVLTRFSFLIRGYRPRYYFWESVVLARRAAVVVIIAGVDDVTRQTQAILFVLTAALVVHVNAQPFMSRAANRYETTSISMLLLIFNCMLSVLTDPDVDADASVLLFSLGGSTDDDDGGADGAGDAHAPIAYVFVFVAVTVYATSFACWFAYQNRTVPRTLFAALKQRVAKLRGNHDDDGGGGGGGGGGMFDVRALSVRQVAALSNASDGGLAAALVVRACVDEHGGWESIVSRYDDNRRRARTRAATALAASKGAGVDRVNDDKFTPLMGTLSESDVIDHGHAADSRVDYDQFDGSLCKPSAVVVEMEMTPLGGY